MVMTVMTIEFDDGRRRWDSLMQEDAQGIVEARRWKDALGVGRGFKSWVPTDLIIRIERNSSNGTNANTNIIHYHDTDPCQEAIMVV